MMVGTCPIPRQLPRLQPSQVAAIPTTLEVEVTARATAKDEGYDPVSFRNGVEEPLVEGSAEDLRIELS